MVCEIRYAHTEAIGITIHIQNIYCPGNDDHRDI